MNNNLEYIFSINPENIIYVKNSTQIPIILNDFAQYFQFFDEMHLSLYFQIFTIIFVLSLERKSQIHVLNNLKNLLHVKCFTRILVIYSTCSREIFHSEKTFLHNISTLRQQNKLLIQNYKIYTEFNLENFALSN